MIKRGHMGYLLEVKDRIKRLYAYTLQDIINYIDYVGDRENEQR